MSDLQSGRKSVARKGVSEKSEVNERVKYDGASPQNTNGRKKSVMKGKRKEKSEQSLL